MVEASAHARVFISYSRADLESAEQIRAALLDVELEAFLDQHDIAPGEPWRARLGALIQSAEKVIFLISPTSVKSEICDWEVNHAELLGKSVLPVMIRETSLDDIPERLKRLNFIFMRDEAERDAKLGDFIEALTTDLEWEREKTRIGGQAVEWDRAGRPNRLLLRTDDEIRVAENWRDRHPGSSPPPTELQRLFIASSRERHVRRQRQRVAVAVGVAVSLAILAIVALFQRAEAVRQEKLAIEQRDLALSSQSRILAQQARERLNDGDHAAAMQLALDGLPDLKSSDEIQRLRPTVAETRRALHAALRGLRERIVMTANDQPIADVTFSPEMPFKVAAAGSDGFARIWDPATGEVKTLGGHSRLVYSVTFVPDGTRLATASEDETIRLWDSKTGKQTAVIDGTSPFLSANFSRDGKTIVSLSLNRSPPVWIWDTATGDRLKPIDGGEASVYSAELDRNGTSLVIASERGVLEVDVTQEGEAVQFVDDTPASYASLSPDGGRVLVIAQGDTRIIRVLEVDSHREVARMRSDSGEFKRAEFSPDGEHIVTASTDGTARIWDISKSEEVARLAGHESDVNTAEFSPDGNSVVTGSADGTARLWDGRIDRRQTTSLKGELQSWSADLALNESGAWLVAGLTEVDLAIWEEQDGVSPRLLSTAGAGSPIDIDVSSDGSRVAAIFADASAQVWDVSGHAILAEPFRFAGEEAKHVALSADGTRIAIASDREAQVWDLRSEAQTEAFALPGDATLDLIFAPDGDGLAIVPAGAFPRLRYFGSDSETPLCRGEGIVVSRIAFSPKGGRVACIVGQQVLIWDPEAHQGYYSLQELCAQDDRDQSAAPLCLDDHATTVQHVVFSADGGRVAMLSRDGAPLRIWDAANGDELARFDDIFPIGANDALALAAFTPDGREVITLSVRGELGRWRVYPTTQDLVDEAKRVLPLCLAPDGTKAYDLCDAGRDAEAQ